MTLFSMGVMCNCSDWELDGQFMDPSPDDEQPRTFQGYAWTCPRCKVSICVKLDWMGDDEE